MKNFFAKKIGKFFNLIIGGKPNTLQAKNDEEEKELLELSKKASTGDEESLQQIKDKIQTANPKKEHRSELEKIETKKSVVEQELNIKKNELQAKQNYYNILNRKDIFRLETDGVNQKVFLKGFKSELPPILIDKFIQNIQANEPIDDLVDFWMLNLTQENSEARRGLYNFITKQKLIVTKHGYFIGFRRIVSVKKSNVTNIKTTVVDEKILNEFINKTRKQKKGLHTMSLVQLENNSYILQSSSVKNFKGRNLGTLKSLLDAVEINKNVINDEKVYTDAHTRTMKIKIGEPVKIPRSKCNKNSKIECSFGLHIGSQTYVSNNSGLGDTIVACLINPQHVISVPYADAHKMRVCEYYPFMELTHNQLINFNSIDVEKYCNNYKKIESVKLKKALDVMDSLSADDLNKFKSNISSVKVEDVNELNDKYQKINNEYKMKTQELQTIFEDDISNLLDYEELNAILKSRLQ